ncbi:MAG: ABC transporter substrate-binding protein [Polyangiaceae bacterium]
MAISILIAGAAIAAVGCGGSGSGESPSGSGTAGGAAATKVKLALNWVPEPEFGGFYAAREEGSFAKQGLDVEIMPGGAGVPVVQMVAGGQADFGISGADEILTARSRGADVVGVFAIYQKAPQGIMARPEKTSMADVFASGTVALEPGLAYAQFLKKKYGFDKVKIVPYDGGVARFLSEKDYSQQCFATSEPLAARRKGVDPKVFLVADEGFNPYQGVVIVKKSTWESKPDLVKRFVAAAREGWQKYQDDPSKANAVMAKLNTAMDAETFAEAAKAQRDLVATDETKANGLGSMTKERWETLAKQLVELGQLEKEPNAGEAFVKP